MTISRRCMSRIPSKAKPRVLFDPNAMSKDGTVALSTWQPSPDGKWLAYGIAQAGSDWQTWHVRSVRHRQGQRRRIEWIKFSSPAWDADSKGFYYSRFEKPEGKSLTGVNEGHQLWHHRLGTPQSADTKIYERPDHKDWLLIPDRNGRRAIPGDHCLERNLDTQSDLLPGPPSQRWKDARVDL